MAHFPFYVGTLPLSSSIVGPSPFLSDSSITADRRETRDVRGKGHLTRRLDLSTRYTSQIEGNGMTLAAAPEARRS